MERRHRREAGSRLRVLGIAAVLICGIVGLPQRSTECAIPQFVRADTDANGALEITDGIRILRYLFSGGQKLDCLSAADTNDDNAVDISDGIYVLSYLFLGGPAIPEPHGSCGTDPTPDELGCLESPCGVVVAPAVVFRAASLVEELRGTGMAPEWEGAFADEAPAALYRPGLPDVAYWEFPVWVPDPHSARLLAAGSIVLSDGEHDSPVACLRDTGKAFTRSLAEEAKSRGKSAAKFFLVDTSVYAAEDESGQLVATIGELPPKLTGQRRESLDDDEGLTRVAWEAVPGPNELPDFQRVQTGPGFSREVQLGEWSSWGELKEEFGRSYGVLLENVRREARQDWEAEALVEASGEGLEVGETFRLPLVPSGCRYRTSGEGTKSARIEVVERPGGGRALEITPIRADPERGLPIEAAILQTAGESEVEVLRRRFVKHRYGSLPVPQRTIETQSATTHNDLGKLRQPLLAALDLELDVPVLVAAHFPARVVIAFENFADRADVKLTDRSPSLEEAEQIVPPPEAEAELRIQGNTMEEALPARTPWVGKLLASP